MATIATAMHSPYTAEPVERAPAFTSYGEKLGCRGQHGQQSTLRLLCTLSAELNAVDAHGLTPLLCAYGATLLFASEQTEAQLVGHSAEVIAAAAVVEHHTGGGNVVTSVTAGTEPAASQERLLNVTATTDSMSSRSSLPTAWTSPRAQLSAPAIAVTTNAVSSLGERYYTQLTPSTQEVLRQAAKSGSAEYLLLSTLCLRRRIRLAPAPHIQSPRSRFTHRSQPLSPPPQT
ncbi:hypothetical protein NXY56_000328 [Leishmania guyanensis]